jgi:rhodanese-related sulfurtransferase
MTTLASLQAAARGTTPEIDAQELAARWREDGLVVVDVRDSQELVASGSVPGAIHVPRGSLEFALADDSPDRMAPLVRATTLVLYCGSGGRSLLAAATARQLGRPAFSLAGGFKAWVAAGQPVRPPA